MDPIHIGLELALRLEGAEASNSEAVIARAAVMRPGAGAESIAICGGRASFAGPGSPLSQMLHIGLAGPVSSSEWNRMERFFRERESAAVISLCPYADPSVFEWLSKRHYRISQFENTLVRQVSAADAEGDSRIASLPAGLQEWALAIIEGFAGPGPANEGLEQLVTALGSAPVSTALEVRSDQEITAGAILGVVGRTAIFHCDSTIERFRGKGLQSALIRERLRRAALAGCDLAMACTVPGTISQRNYERAGFRVAYTKTMLVKNWN